MTEPSGLNIVEIELTNRCNLDCKHCYVDKTEILSIDRDKIASLIDEVTELSVHRLVFTGGEPLLYPGLFSLAAYAKSKGTPQLVLMTNGLLIDEKNIGELNVFDLLQLSIDVPPEGRPHFRIDYLKDLESKIDMLRDRGIKVHLQATIHRSLLPLLDKLCAFVEEKGVTLGLNRLVLTGSAQSLSSEKLTKDELKESLNEIALLKDKHPCLRCSDPLLFLADEKRMALFRSSPKKNISGGCIAGIASLYIRSDGDVLICPFVNSPIANVYRENLRAIWEDNPVLNRLRDRGNLKGKCRVCTYRSYCGGCRGSSLMHTGDLFGSDPNCWLSVDDEKKIYSSR